MTGIRRSGDPIGVAPRAAFPVVAALVLGLCAAAASLGQPVPTYLVERVIDAGGESRRVSVFLDGQAVLVRRRAGEEADVRRLELSGAEMKVLRQVVEECHTELQRARPPSAPVGRARVEYRLAPEGRSPMVVSLPLAGVGSAATVRLGTAIDAVETRLVEERLDLEDLSRWEPEVGERLELKDGSRVLIREVMTRGRTVLVRVEILDAPTVAFWDLDELRRQAVRRLPPP